MFNAPAAPRWPAVTAIAIALAICDCSADGGSQSHGAAGSGTGADRGGVGAGTNLGSAATSGTATVVSTGAGTGLPGGAMSAAGSGAASGATAPQGDGDAAVAVGDGASGSVSRDDASAPTDGNGGAIAATAPFVCSELIGLWVASQWWGTFDKAVDKAHWQFMFQHHGYLELFTDPASPFWKNMIISPCATQSTTPDRVVFLPFSLTLNTLDGWQMQLTKLVETIKGKFPGVRRIEIMTTLRSPGNMLCPNDTDPGTVVPAYVDQAIQAVADQSAGLVTVGPKIAVKDCKWWAGGTDLTGAGNAGVGQLVADYYSAHP